MRIAIGCDHIVTPIKNEIKEYVKSLGHDVIDCGTYDDTRTHYPIYGREVAVQVATKNVDLGIVICGTGVGITNSANKTKGVRAILTRNVSTAIDARRNWNANILGMGGRITGIGLMIEIIDAFLNTEYSKKNDNLIAKIDSLIKYENYDKELLNNEIDKWHNGLYCDGEPQKEVPLPKIESNYEK